MSEPAPNNLAGLIWPIPDVGFSRQSEFVDIVRKGRTGIGEIQKGLAHGGRPLAERRQALVTATVAGRIDVALADAVSVS